MAASQLLGIDYGLARVGLALADSELKFSRPLVTLVNDASLTSELKKIASDHNIDQLIVGLPRNLEGNETSQTASARQFAEQLKQQLELPVYLVDEAATSVDAEAKLKTIGKPYAKSDIDSLSAALILDNYLSEYETK